MFSTELKLRKRQRKFLKKPLGVLISGSGDTAWCAVLNLVAEMKPKKIVAVGDETSRLFLDRGQNADLYIVDGTVMRKKVDESYLPALRSHRLVNPPGFISRKSWGIVSRSLSIGGSRIVDVDGEEDLLTLVAILEAPVGSLVFYGQPGEGLVAVHVTKAKKEEIGRFVGAMERTDGFV